MAYQFEWDQAKADANLRKHGISFTEASSVFGDSYSIAMPDRDHSSPSEDRWLLLGYSTENRLLVVAHIEGVETIRIIHARTATPFERRTYEEEDR